MDLRFKIVLVFLLALQIINCQPIEKNTINENFIEISDIRKIVKFFNSSNDNSSMNQNNDEKSYEIIFIDPQDFIQNVRINQTRQEYLKLNSFGVAIYFWAKWSKWSKCSRTCGGGIQTRIRFCTEKRPSGTDMELNVFEPMINGSNKGCVGVYKRYRICNDKECQNETDHSFHDEQCALHNDSPFRGNFYDWESYVKENNECELNCKPINLNYYATLNKTVIDGTPCKKPAIYFTHFYRNRAVCIEGICKAVHSSGAIRGKTTKDSPFQCGSVLCRPVSELFSKEDIPTGYLYLTTLSVGATNISVIQMDKSENLLVLKAPDDHLIINGNDEPSTNGIYKYHGNFFDYQRGENYEKITASGPLTKPVDLLILAKGKNPGVKYEYYLPIASAGITVAEENASQWNEMGIPLDYLDEPNQLNDTQEAQIETRPIINNNDRRKRNFTWKLIGFAPCNKLCGGGRQSPIFRCILDSPTRFYTPRRCMYAEKPVFHDIIYQCNTQPCPAYWYAEDWSDCYCQGNKGVHRRFVKCLQELQGGVAIQVESNNCIEEKPPIKGYCSCPRQKMPNRSDKSRIYEHLHGNVHSVVHFKNTTNYNQNKNYYNYQHQKDKQKGFREDKTDKTGVWLISNWNQHCSTDKCGDFGIEYRSIFCDRTQPFTDRCDLRNTPDTTRPCQNEENCDIGTWFNGNWSECHGDCFNLYSYRQVYCIKNEIIMKDENQCLLEKKPEMKKKCSLDDVNYCKARWHYSEWTECSRTCDGGTQKRFIKCLEIDPIENILRESKNCRYMERQPVYSTCNTQKCDSDEFETNEIENKIVVIPECIDKFKNCQLISERNKENLCKSNYYLKNCCKTCRNY